MGVTPDAGARLRTLGGDREETADQRALSPVVMAETRLIRFGEEVGVASSSPGSRLVGSSTTMLGCVFSSASATCLKPGLLIGESGGKDTPVVLLRVFCLWRRYKRQQIKQAAITPAATPAIVPPMMAGVWSLLAETAAGAGTAVEERDATTVPEGNVNDHAYAPSSQQLPEPPTIPLQQPKT